LSPKCIKIHLCFEKISQTFVKREGRVYRKAKKGKGQEARKGEAGRKGSQGMFEGGMEIIPHQKILDPPLALSSRFSERQ
jgi:hypothetical protein